MGFFGKLFDKKECSICGGEIGLLGNRRLEDGNMCKSCAANPDVLAFSDVTGCKLDIDAEILLDRPDAVRPPRGNVRPGMAAQIVIISETDEAASWKSVRRADNV